MMIPGICFVFWFYFLQETQVPPWVGKIPWRREWLPTPVFLLGEFHEQRSLVGNSPGGHKESDVTEKLTLSLSLPFHWLHSQTGFSPNHGQEWSPKPDLPSSGSATPREKESHSEVTAKVP